MSERAVRTKDLGTRFNELFNLTVALESDSLEQVFRIRHEVY